MTEVPEEVKVHEVTERTEDVKVTEVSEEVKVHEVTERTEDVKVPEEVKVHEDVEEESKSSNDIENVIEEVEEVDSTRYTVDYVFSALSGNITLSEERLHKLILKDLIKICKMCKIDYVGKKALIVERILNYNKN